MPVTTYTYSISNDFPADKVDADRLGSEIRASAIVTALDSISTLGDDCNIAFKDALSVGDEAVLDALVAVHDGTPLPDNIPTKVEFAGSTGVSSPRTGAGSPLVAFVKMDDLKTTIYSHLWNDKTTWFGQAVRVVAEAASDQGAGLWGLANDSVVDTYHGKLLGEDYLLDQQGNSYRMIVTVDGAPSTEQDPHNGSGGDYTVDYDAGQIQFTVGNQPAPGADVRVTYHRATGSRFVVAPDPGKALSIDSVEVQFSDDVKLTDSAVFQIMGLVDVFAPQLMPGVPSGTKIPLSNPLVYKTIRDYLNDARKSYPTYPAMGGAGWRGLATPVLVFSWDYVAATVLKSSYGMEIWISLQHEVPFGGTFASATIYATSRPE
jgi:hypothetical protein